jgi:hypothetical protein
VNTFHGKWVKLLMWCIPTWYMFQNSYVVWWWYEIGKQMHDGKNCMIYLLGNNLRCTHSHTCQHLLFFDHVHFIV